MYKKIKIKSPNKRQNQGSFNQGAGLTGSGAGGNLYKQTTSSALKRQQTQ